MRRWSQLLGLFMIFDTSSASDISLLHPSIRLLTLNFSIGSKFFLCHWACAESVTESAAAAGVCQSVCCVCVCVREIPGEGFVVWRSIQASPLYTHTHTQSVFNSNDTHADPLTECFWMHTGAAGNQTTKLVISRWPAESTFWWMAFAGARFCSRMIWDL